MKHGNGTLKEQNPAILYDHDMLSEENVNFSGVTWMSDGRNVNPYKGYNTNDYLAVAILYDFYLFLYSSFHPNALI